ncbi:hypothetical protein SLEP1_g56482 [Rubroshorea leprosula]|uniref:F-box protein n=1 Tax=Rubroshorea leprosula TaxID=152421 RepID=A0AAV5MIF6_9ROSI|nr:hypothetical protein SLEP1_g56482 [Rubroshorea leprosula]
MVCCCPEARLAEKKQGWAVLNRFQGPLVQIGFGSLQLGWAAAFPPMCRAISIRKETAIRAENEFVGREQSREAAGFLRRTHNLQETAEILAGDGGGGVRFVDSFPDDLVISILSKLSSAHPPLSFGFRHRFDDMQEIK